MCFPPLYTFHTSNVPTTGIMIDVTEGELNSVQLSIILQVRNLPR